MIYAIESRDRKGQLAGGYVTLSLSDSRLTLMAAWPEALKFSDKGSAERFRIWMNGPRYHVDLNRTQVTEHEEVGPADSEKEQVEDLGETLTKAIKEIPDGYKIKCDAVRFGNRAILNVEVIPNDQEFNALPSTVESIGDDVVKKLVVNPEAWDDGIVDCPLADQDCICGLAYYLVPGVVKSCQFSTEESGIKCACPLEKTAIEMSLF